MGVPDCKTDNGKNARMQETNMYANAMHEMTRYEMHENENKRGAPEEVGVPDCKTDNGENARMHETNTYANEMRMMT